jgi:hypothetical protein
MFALYCRLVVLVFLSLTLNLLRILWAGIFDMRFQTGFRCESFPATFALYCRLVVLVFLSLTLNLLRSFRAGVGDVRFQNAFRCERLGAMFALQIARLVFLRWLRLTFCKNNIENNPNRMTREQTVEETC